MEWDCFLPRFPRTLVNTMVTRCGFVTMSTAAVTLLATVAQAGPGDSPAGVLEATALAGETTERVCLSNGFIQVLFINSSGVVVSRIESGTRCDPNADNGDDDDNALSGQQAGSQVDGVLQQIVPGGIDGDLFGDFGIPSVIVEWGGRSVGGGLHAEVISFAALDSPGAGGNAAARAYALSGGSGRQPALLAPAEASLLGEASPGSKSLSGSYNLATARAQGGGFSGLLGDKRFNAWVNGGVVFHDNDRPGLGQSGETGVVSGGASYLISPNVNVGLAGRYGDTSVSGAGGATDAETWSGAVFTQVELPANFWFAAMLAYSDVDIDARFVQPGVTAKAGRTRSPSRGSSFWRVPLCSMAD